MKRIFFILLISSNFLYAKADNVMFKDYPFCQDLKESGYEQFFARYCASELPWAPAQICNDLAEIDETFQAYENYCLVPDPICVYKTSSKLKKGYACNSDEYDYQITIDGTSGVLMAEDVISTFHLVDEYLEELTYNGYDSQMGNFMEIIFTPSNGKAVLVDHYMYSVESYQFSCTEL